MFLPLIPLVLVFAAHFLPSIKIDVITANFIGFAVTFVCEFIVRKDRSRIPSDMAEIFKGMANVFVSVVAIIISASVFAEGIKILGGITIFTNMISDMKGATLLIMAILTGITYVFAIIMGSGAAPFFAFGPLTPAVAAKLGVPTLTLLDRWSLRPPSVEHRPLSAEPSSRSPGLPDLPRSALPSAPLRSFSSCSSST